MKRMLIVGGSNGIGLSIATEMAKNSDCEKIYIVDRIKPADDLMNTKFKFYQFDLCNTDFSFFKQFKDIDSLIITAGFGKLALFKDLDEQYIIDSINVNTTAAIRIIHYFYDRISHKDNFYCGIMVSIAGFMSSPFFSVYGASKAALKVFIESVNVELKKAQTNNRILNISPGLIKGTNFYNGKTDLELTKTLALDIIKHLQAKDDLFIPQYNEVFKDVLERYHKDFRAEGIHSYEYKEKNRRINL